ncbi:hypothetical protein R5W23_000145 [Gemmata sp. JC673]|uniref:ATP-binding protein n=1 Tax=Gemmata algarum TaxID=2975278 RepID=A0ABU5ERL0_9BACT|nr:hypothetical protein [Gemmata algarum]MDY3557618.1 hypothetical protein [Gemmata algarum]
MAKKKVTKADIQGQYEVFRLLGIRLVRSKSGELFLATSPTGKPGGSVELQPYDLAESCEEIKWVLREANKSADMRLVAEAVKGLVRSTKKSPPEMVSRRVAERDGKIFVDLCDAKRQVVEISADGWRVTTDCPALFHRPLQALPLPVPVQDGSIQRLRELFSILDEPSWILVLGWLSTTLKEHCDHPFLSILGPPGSGKSALTKFAYCTIDPREAKGLQMQQNAEDLQLSAFNRWVLPLDEVDSLPPEKSRIVATICTGGALEKRKKYEDTEVVCAVINRPAIINGLEAGEWLHEERIRDRAIPVTLSRVRPEASVEDGDLIRAFERHHPEILGGLFTIVSRALRGVRDGEASAHHALRIKEAMTWADRCVHAAGYPKGEFTRLVTEAHARVVERVAEEWPLLDPLLKVAGSGFQGSPTELLDKLNSMVERKGRDWPKSSSQLTRAINLHIDYLEKRGVRAEHTKGQQRFWVIRSVPSSPQKSADSVNAAKPLASLSEGEQSDLKSKLLRWADFADKIDICFTHRDSSNTLYGRFAEAASIALKRTLEPDRTLRIPDDEFLSLDTASELLLVEINPRTEGKN